MSFQTKEDFAKQLQIFDQWIKEGKGVRVRKRLRELVPKNIPRKHAVEFANVSRRVDLPYLSLRILSHIIRPIKPIYPAASPLEKMNYAAGLNRVGVHEEAFAILDEVDSSEYPQALFYKALGLIDQWNYKETIPLLKKYTKSSKITEYQSAIGQVNLLAAYINNFEIGKGEKLFVKLLKIVPDNGWKLLHGNILELGAQLALAQNQFSRAEFCIHLSLKKLQHSKSNYQFFCKKWETFIPLLKNAAENSSVRKLEELRQEAQKKEFWETVRECDLYLALSSNNEKLFEHVWFGTSYPHYRNKMKRMAKKPYKASPCYIWKLQSHENEIERGFDTSTAREISGTARLKFGRSSHKLLCLLTQDFYRPRSLGFIFSQLYPGEYFNTETSPQRVGAVLKRLREWFRKNEIPLKIELNKGNMLIESTSPYFIKIPYKKLSADPREHQLNILKAKWPYQVFYSHQVGELLNLSRTSALGLLKWAANKKKVCKMGQGRGTCYRFSK